MKQSNVLQQINYSLRFVAPFVNLYNRPIYSVDLQVFHKFIPEEVQLQDDFWAEEIEFFNESIQLIKRAPECVVQEALASDVVPALWKEATGIAQFNSICDFFDFLKQKQSFLESLRRDKIKPRFVSNVRRLISKIIVESSEYDKQTMHHYCVEFSQIRNGDSDLAFVDLFVVNWMIENDQMRILRSEQKSPFERIEMLRVAPVKRTRKK